MDLYFISDLLMLEVKIYIYILFIMRHRFKFMFFYLPIEQHLIFYIKKRRKKEPKWHLRHKV